MTRTLFLASVSTLALAWPALSQDATTTSDDPVFVLGTITLSVDDVAGYFANGAQVTKSSVPLAETQQSISVVTNQQITDQNARSLGQTLNYSAGVLGEPYAADPRFDSPTLRGFEARSAQYYNGLRQLRALGAPAREVYGLQQVEVLRAPNSSLYGAGLPAGIINLVQKRAQASDFGEAGVGVGSHNSPQAFFDINRAPSANLSWRLTGIVSHLTPQIDQLENKRGYLAGALRYSPDDLTTIDFLMSYTKDAPISPPGVPFALTESGDGKALRDTYYGEPSYDESDRKIFNTGLEISHELDNGWTLSQGFRYETFDWTYTGHYVSGVTADGLFVTRGANYQDESSTGINLDTRLTGEVVTGSITHQILTGLDIRHYDADTTTKFFLNNNPINATNPIYGGLPEDTAWYTSISSIKQRQIGLYVQDELSMGNWRGSVALRQDWTKQTGDTYTNFAGAGEVDQSDNATTGRLGLSYVMANGVIPYVSYATSFDPEIGTDSTTGRTLKPTEGKQWELGVKYQPTAFEGLFTAAIYDLTQENLTRNLGTGLRRQIGEVKSKGLELEGTVELAAGWDIRGAYSYNKTEQVGGPEDGLEMPNAPRHLASLWLDRDFGNGFRVGGGIRHIGSRKGDFGNVYDLDSVTLLEIGGSYTRDNLEASLNIGNLADKVYVANCGSFGCYYGEGRNVTAKVAYKW